jgi:hypothetical protein
MVQAQLEIDGAECFVRWKLTVIEDVVRLLRYPCRLRGVSKPIDFVGRQTLTITKVHPQASKQQQHPVLRSGTVS